MNLKEGEVVLCTVDRIVGTSVFVKIENNTNEGVIILSEIAPGRIRNLREYVVPNKKIVCKIIRIENNRIDLSLRRVSEKERKEVMDRHDSEKNSINILKSVLKEKAEETIRKIKSKEASIYAFLQRCKDNPALLEELTGKTDAEKICSILLEKKEKDIEVRKEIDLTSRSPSGIEIIKYVLAPCVENCSITYIAAGKFLLKIKSKDYKLANSALTATLAEIEKRAKEKHAILAIKEK